MNEKPKTEYVRGIPNWLRQWLCGELSENVVQEVEIVFRNKDWATATVRMVPEIGGLKKYLLKITPEEIKAETNG